METEGAKTMHNDLAWLDAYNVVWTSPSRHSGDSMPCGGGDIGLNVWVEQGDVLFYLQRSGCFDENNEYLKLGRVRVQLDPNPFAEGGQFRQELRLQEGHVVLWAARDGVEASLAIWVEVSRPVVHVDVQSSQPVAVEAVYEGWRNDDEELPDDFKDSRFGCFSWDGYPGAVYRYRDSVAFDNDGVLFYHRNRDDRLLFDFMVKQQGLEEVRDELVDTQRGRTFGGILTGLGFRPSGTCTGVYAETSFCGWKLFHGPAETHNLKVFTHVEQTPSIEDWKNALQLLAQTNEPDDQAAREETLHWWDEFWDRSYLAIDLERPESKGWELGRNYQLFRYQLGCNAYGSYPTKFNGGNFTFDPVYVSRERVHTPDWRAWGGGSFTAQNQRLVYWPMLKTGDFGMMLPQFDFYKRALPNAVRRVHLYWGHEGCLFTEQMENFGLPLASAWGWAEPEAKRRQRPADSEQGVQVNPACIYHYESQLEFSYMILEYHRFSGEDIRPYLPFIRQSVRFFDEHYRMRQEKRTGKPLDDNGKLVFYPSSSCESYKGAKNPSDLIAGLEACLTALLALDDELVSPEEKGEYRSFLNTLPDYGFDMVDGDPIMKPAWSWTKYQNCECPQFYPVFPFNRFNLGNNDMAVFRNTWKHGTFPKGLVQSWHQDGIFFARMGMTEEAEDYNTKKMENCNRRFPTFWGPGHDWVPDHNWGGSGMLGLQEMLLQTDGDEIRLLPAWPKDWEVRFRLHAPKQTIVEGLVKNGKLIGLNVTPESRRNDLQIKSHNNP